MSRETRLLCVKIQYKQRFPLMIWNISWIIGRFLIHDSAGLSLGISLWIKIKEILQNLKIFSEVIIITVSWKICCYVFPRGNAFCDAKLVL